VSRILVVDASIVVDLIGRFRPRAIEEQLWKSGTVLAAPELLDIEVLQALRRLQGDGVIPTGRTDIVELLGTLRIRRYRHLALLNGIWALRGHLTAYDAAYVVLARLLDATLLTRDQRLARASGLGIEVLVP